MNDTTTKNSGRQMVLVDIENMTGTASPCPQQVVAVRQFLSQTIPNFDRAHCVVACSHHAAATVAFSFPRARHVWRSGQDVADLALIDVLASERVSCRFSAVTICSGDGIFTQCVVGLAADGVDVVVMSVSDFLSKRLELAAKSVIKLTWAAPWSVESTGEAS